MRLRFFPQPSLSTLRFARSILSGWVHHGRLTPAQALRALHVVVDGEFSVDEVLRALTNARLATPLAAPPRRRPSPPRPRPLMALQPAFRPTAVLHVGPRGFEETAPDIYDDLDAVYREYLSDRTRYGFGQDRRVTQVAGLVGDGYRFGKTEEGRQ